MIRPIYKMGDVVQYNKAFKNMFDNIEEYPPMIVLKVRVAVSWKGRAHYICDVLLGDTIGHFDEYWLELI